MKDSEKDNPEKPDQAQTVDRHLEPEVTLEDLDSISPAQNPVAEEDKAPTRPRLHPHFEAARVDSQFKPGQSGNPGGRRKPIIRDFLVKQAMTVHAHDSKGRTYLELATNAVFLSAIGGSVPAFRELSDRLEGKTAPWQPTYDPADRLDEIVRAIQEPLEEKPWRCRKCGGNDPKDGSE